jgi:hypothetical protein
MFKKFYTLNNVPLWAQNPIYAGLFLTGQFTPASLFTGGEQGGWWSASDLDDTKLAWRRNLLTYTDDLTNAAWSKTTATVTTGILDPDGGFTAFTITATASNADVRQAVGNYGGGNTSIWMRRRTGSGDVQGFTGSSYTSWPSLSTSWQRLSIAMNATNTQYMMLKLLVSGDAIDVWHPQAEADIGPTPTAYQSMLDYNTSFLAAFPNHALFQDSAGTTAVTGVEQPVGLIKDKSGRGNNLSQATGSLKPVWSARKNLLLATATLSTQNATTVATPYTISHTGTGTITLSGTSTAGPLVGAGSLTFTPTAGTLTITVSGTVSNAQLEYGTSVTSYQSVVTSTNYNAVGFPKYFLADGVDDKVSGGVNLTATKQASVFYTVQFSDSSGFDGLFIHGTSADGIFAYGNASGIESKVASASTTSSALFNSVVGAGLPKVFTHQYDTTGATGSLCVKLRVSGVAQTDASGSETSGSGFLLNSTFSIFEATGVYLTGAMNEIVLLSRTPTGAEITNTEAFLTSKIG